MYRKHSHKQAPKLTAEQARTFDKISEASAAEIAAAVRERAATGLYPACNCQPYQDIFTYDRWSAQGCYVRKGEKSLARLLSYAEVKEERDGQETVKRIPHPYWLFCRCQITVKDGTTITPTEVVPAPAPLPTPAYVEQPEAEPVAIPIRLGKRFAALEV
jgi:hypothetical protein